MPLEKAQHEQFTQWLESKHAIGSCLVCRAAKTWESGELVGVPVRHPAGSIAVSEEFVPMVQLFCQNCGYTAHFSAKIVGLV